MNKQHKELSWFKLSLLHFLYESHPELTDDNDLLNTRGDQAAKIYSESILNGHTHIEAEELAHKELYKGLHFSKHDTLVTIIWNEFSGVISMGEAKAFAIQFQANVEPIFEKYLLNDEFVYSPKFNDLYTELTGALAIWLEEHEL